MKNDKVYEMASLRAGMEITNNSEVVEERAVKLWAHLIRAEDSDIMKAATFDTGRWAEGECGERLRPGHRRVGRPRMQWADIAETSAWNILGKKGILEQTPYTGDRDQRQRLTGAARDRII